MSLGLVSAPLSYSIVLLRRAADKNLPAVIYQPEGASPRFSGNRTLARTG
jgi:hypothetical protein